MVYSGSYQEYLALFSVISEAYKHLGALEWRIRIGVGNFELIINAVSLPHLR